MNLRRYRRFGINDHINPRFLIFAITVAFLALCTLRGARAVGDAPGTYSFETTPIILTIRGEKFQIPRNYLDRYTPRKEQENISFEVMLPDFEPISRQTFKCFISQNVCDRIVFAIIFDHTVPRPMDQIQGYFHRPDVKTKPGPYGLTQYENSPFRWSDVYSARLRDGEFYWIACFKDRPPFNLCEYYERLDNRTSLKYRFKRTQLKNWERIHTTLLSLIAAFRASETR